MAYTLGIPPSCQPVGKQRVATYVVAHHIYYRCLSIHTHTDRKHIWPILILQIFAKALGQSHIQNLDSAAKSIVYTLSFRSVERIFDFNSKGNNTVNVEPWPKADFTLIVPPCSSMIFLVRDRPMPCPL